MALRVLRKGSRQKRKDYDEESGQARGGQSPYQLASYQQDTEGKRFKSSNVAYSFWSASKYIFILSLVLFWLPLFGPMIAGYVGGRRAGGPWKGIAAAILPVVALFFLITAFETGFFPSHVFGVAIAPSAIQAALADNALISPYVDFSSTYLGDFVSSLESASPYGINPYILTVLFAYIGGIIAEQHRREIEYASGAVVSNTTVLVHNNGRKHHELGDAEPHPGMFASIASHLRLPMHEDNSLSAGYVHRKHHRDQWAKAVNMRYPDGARGRADRRGSQRGEDLDVYDDDSIQHFGDSYAASPRGESHWRHRRRGRPNHSAKPRFSYPEYEQRPERQDKPSHWKNSTFMSIQKASPRFSVAPDPKSIRRARKIIDREWNGKHRYSSYASMEQEEPEVEAVAEEPEASVHRRKEQHNNWDTI